MSTKTKTGQGWLSNAFTSPKWNSRITSANTTKKEMWLGYVLGVWGMMVTNSIVNSYFNQYLTDVIGFDSTKGAWIASFMVLFPVVSKIIDAITNLIMAKVIDSTTCKQGKVRPWLLISTPFVFVSIILLFWMPFQSPKAQAIWIAIAFNFYYAIAYTMWNISKELMPALSTRNVNQRKNLAMAAQIVGNVGTGLVSILFPTILAAVCGMTATTAQGYLVSMSMVAVVAVALAFVQYFYTRERVTEERRNQSGIAAADSVKLEIHQEAGMWEQFKACLTSKYWILFVIIVLFYNICGNLRNISLIYYSGWVVNGNAYGNVAAIQAKFQMIALSPMGPGILLMLPLTKKYGRTKTIWTTSIMTIVGSVLAFLSAGKGTMIYAGTALGAIGNISFSYMIMTYMGDIIDQVEWKTGTRTDGLTGGFISAVMMFSVGIAQGLFNLGLMMTGYAKPEMIGTSAEGIALYADQATAAVNWINLAYQGSFIVIGVVVFFIFCFVFKIEKDMPTISRELQERRVAEFAAKGIEYIPADELERREREQADAETEAIRIQELKEKCAKKGLDFDKENQKVLVKRAAKEAKKAAKAAKKAK